MILVSRRVKLERPLLISFWIDRSPRTLSLASFACCALTSSHAFFPCGLIEAKVNIASKPAVNLVVFVSLKCFSLTMMTINFLLTKVNIVVIVVAVNKICYNI